MKRWQRRVSLLMVIVLALGLGWPLPQERAHAAAAIDDPLNDASKAYAYSTNWVFDTTNPTYFGGDSSRVTRSNLSTGYLVYRLAGMLEFSAVVHKYAASTGTVKFYTSPDNSTWTQAATVNSAPVVTGNASWSSSTYEQASALPSNAEYLKVELSGDYGNWHLQIGSVTVSDGSSAPVTITDELADNSKMYAVSANWMVDSTNASYFGGDTNRKIRTGLTTESFTYHLDDLQAASVVAHRYAGSTAVLRLYGSSDHATWTELLTQQGEGVATGDPGWQASTYSIVGKLPAGVDYLKVEVSGDAAAWAFQLGSVTVSNVWGGIGSEGGFGDYYVDSVSGSDSNDGLSPSAAWKTFSHVNNTIFAPGDRILLKKGSVWNERLYPKGSGTSADPIEIDSYGTGNRPVVNGGGIAGGAVYLRNPSYWTIQNLEVTNYAATRGDVYREGILLENADGGTRSGIRIVNNYVHDVSGSFRYPTVAGYSGGPHAFGGISVYTGGTTGTDRFDDVLIEGNSVEDVGRSGIVVWDNVWNGSGYASTNVVIRQNSVKRSDSDGILTFGADGALIEHNVAEGIGWYSELNQFNGSAAIWPTRGKNNVVQYNEAFNTRRTEGDGQGFNLDMDSKDSVIQYNYSHDNEGGFVLLVDAPLVPGVENGSENSIVRYNVSQNDLKHLITFAGGVTEGTQIYNNTFYIGKALTTRIIDHEWDEAGDLNGHYSFKNNLVYNLGKGDYKLPGANGTFDSNLFYGNHPANEPSDPNKITANPLLVYQGGGGTGWSTVGGYKLRAGSPALGAGAVIASNGGKDYWGNAVSAASAPSIGAYNGAGIDPNTVPAAPDDGFIPTYFHYTVVPAISSGSKQLKVIFNNPTSSAMTVNSIDWSVGALSGTATSIPSIPANSSWTFVVSLPGLADGTMYALDLTAEIAGYEDLVIDRTIDFNRVLPLADTSGAVTIDLADGTNLVSGYTGAADLSGQVKLRWDAANLYLQATIVDNVASNGSSGSSIYANDSLQFSIAPGMPGDSASWYEYGISQTPSGPEVYRWLAMGTTPVGAVTGATLTVSRNATASTTTYNLTLPWTELAPIAHSAGDVLSFSLAVNDNDGAGRKGYIEWGSGIGGTKDASLFRSLILVP
ncbi:sugar-binding protein [Cohnella fermenti]|uniref:Right handed beta helix domain-containing protein n=1 Tax=Cohnella fermenti TaxID=2565925 RepID=A0A4S4BGZ2_9BACL|nr:sugar-binding protein [Cohnella fermenti]THF73752.1 hypothetical protein E6C55_28075 [Cohnella fermenti]